MANHKSAEKRIRRNEAKYIINHARKSRISTFIKRVEKAIADNNKKLAKEEFRLAESEIMRGVSKGILHLNTAARRVSKLSSRVKNIDSANAS